LQALWHRDDRWLISYVINIWNGIRAVVPMRQHQQNVVCAMQMAASGAQVSLRNFYDVLPLFVLAVFYVCASFTP